jgi:hypothetical protein
MGPSKGRKAFPVTCYLDESATDGNTPTAVVGGVLLNSSGVASLDKHWGSMLDEFALRPALHMKDFGLHGRFASMSSQKKHTLFARAVEIIVEHRIYTLSATLDHDDYRNTFSEGTRFEHSAYELCFIATALGNGKAAEYYRYELPIAYIVDAGNPYAEHVVRAHQEMEKLSRESDFPRNVGSLTFGDDEKISALQAADIICWSARRRATSSKFPQGLTLLETLFDAAGHLPVPIEKVALQALEDHFQSKRPKE